MTERILAPLRGVTIRAFRETFAVPIAEAGFTEAVTPFITATGRFDPLRDRELRPSSAAIRHPPSAGHSLVLTPQFIGKDPAALKFCLERVKSAGYSTADLNCGCPFPMVRNKGRGSGLLRTPDVLARMLETGCEAMGPGKFSMKARLGVDRADELLGLMKVVNEFPLRFLTVHARTARQMYGGDCDKEAFKAIRDAARMKVVYNGDAELGYADGDVMIGRGFVRALGEREDIGELMDCYLECSREELDGSESAVLGRIKELLSYWKGLRRWRGRWEVGKLARNLDEIRVWR